MSLVEQMLGAECLDPCGDVSFVAVLRCVSLQAVQRCEATFSNCGGEAHVEESAGAYHFLFVGPAGLDVDGFLGLMGRLLDEPSVGVELVETKVVNNKRTHIPQHSFVFKRDGSPGDRHIILSPSHAFGSGDHPSTGLAIEFLEELAPLAGDVLDVGCGTGVLSFVALQLCAESVLGIDIDDEGIRGARVNATLNGLAERARFENRSLGGMSAQFPLILANLTCSVLKYLLADLSALASPGTVLVVSGLQGRQAVEATAFLGDYGWVVSATKSAGKWQALLATLGACPRI